ncbi:MAG: indolepyruvate oxidoreductase subunit beta [Lachnospiraceae bacterium]
MMKSILLCGVGGQGTILASKLIACAAMEKGLEARSAETIGMAQRGGSVVSHIRIGNQIESPMIPLGAADVIIGFEPGEAVRVLPYLKEGGCVIVCPDSIQPVTASLGMGSYNADKAVAYIQKVIPHTILVQGTAICEACHSAKVLNMALLGAAAGDVLGISMSEMEQALITLLPEKFREMNEKALRLGAQS